MQWRNEIEAHTDGLKVVVWHGSARESDISQLQKYDVVLTSYAILERCVFIPYPFLRSVYNLPPYTVASASSKAASNARARS